MANGEDNTFDIKANAQKYGPKSANKLMLFMPLGMTGNYYHVV